MEKHAPNLLIAYQDGPNGLKDLAVALKDRFAKQAKVHLRPASELAITEVLAADVYLFAVAELGAPVWGELRRVATGINLADRSAGFAGPAAEGAAFRSLFAASELRFPVADLEPKRTPPAGPGFEAWCASFEPALAAR